MKSFLISLGCLSLPSSLFSAEIISTFSATGGAWETAGNWSPSGIPSNTVTNQYQVILPPGLASPVNMVNSRTVNQFTVGAGSTLRFGPSVQVGFSGDSVNNGVMDFGLIGGTFSGLLINDPVDQLVTLSGSGRVVFTGATAAITAAIQSTLIHGSGHRVEGFGNLGGNRLNILNRGTVLGNSIAGPLTVDTAVFFDNDGGTVLTEAPGSLRLLAGSYSSANGGTYEIGDGAPMELVGDVALRDMAIRPRDLDANPDNNVLKIVSNPVLGGTASAGNVTLATRTEIADALILTLVGDVTNEGRISTIGPAGILFGLRVNALVNGTATMRGPGSLVLSGDTHSVTAAISGQTFIQDTGHTIEGRGRIGGGSANIINRGTILANSAGATLQIDPQATFHNNGGTVTASNTGILRLTAPAITQANGGRIVLPDTAAGTVQFNFSKLTGGVIDVLDSNNNLDDNIPVVTNDLTLKDLTNRARLTIPGGRKLALEGVIQNESAIKVTSTGQLIATGQLQLNGAAPTDEVTLSGAGSLEVSGTVPRVLGTGTIVNGPGHRLQVPYSSFLTFQESPIPGVRRIRNEGVLSLVLNSPLNAGTGTATKSLFDSVWQTSGILKLKTEGPAADDHAGRLGPSFLVEDGEIHAQAGFDGTAQILELKPASVLDRPTLKPGGDSIGNFGNHPHSGGLLKLHPGSRLEMQVDSASSHDTFTPNRNGATIDGGPELVVDFRGNSTTLPAGSVITFMTSGSAQLPLSFEWGGGGFVFAFSNVSSGGRIVAKQGNASFLFTYIPQPFPLPTTLNSSSRATLSQPQFGPEFTGTPYSFTIPAASAPGAAVGTVTAVDPEAGTVQYSLAAGSPFAINPGTGAITVSGPLATAGQSLYSLTVTASDGTLFNRTNVSVSVTGLPVNNASCVFSLLTGPGGPFAGQSDPAVVGFSADPDKDGLGNVFELWLGTNPAVPDGGGDLTVKLVPNGAASSVALEVSVNPAVDDLLAVGGFLSHELATFRAGTRSVLSETGGIRRLRFLDTLPAAGSKGFGQLRAEPAAMKP